MSKKIICCCCGKQVVSYARVDERDKRIAPFPVTLMGIDQYACADCSKDLDENGLFPEEALEAKP